MPAKPSARALSSSGSDSLDEPQESTRGRQPRRTPSPHEARQQPASPASSYASAHRDVPAIEKWTVVGLRQALTNADVSFTRRMSKAELHGLLASSQEVAPMPRLSPSRKTAARKGKARSSPYSRPAAITPAGARASAPYLPQLTASIQTIHVRSNRPRLIRFSAFSAAISFTEANITAAITTAGTNIQPVHHHKQPSSPRVTAVTASAKASASRSPPLQPAP